MTRLFLIRHGDAYDLEGVQLEDHPLNNFGKIQALQLAKRLKDNKFSAMYCSKIRRSIETCEIVNEHHQLEVIYSSKLNEVGSENWPQPGVISRHAELSNFDDTVAEIHDEFKSLVSNNLDKEIIVFTHGNWIRGLLTKILANGRPETFTHFVISNTSITIIDIDDDGFEHIITVSDSAHNHIYQTRI